MGERNRVGKNNTLIGEIRDEGGGGEKGEMRCAYLRYSNVVDGDGSEGIIPVFLFSMFRPSKEGEKHAGLT